MNKVLFHSSMGDVSSRHIKSALQAVAADECDVLYIHTDMTFGLPVLKRGEVLGELLEVIESLGVGTLVFPTFTFSFCNNEVFDVQNSRTAMGALNEFARKSGRGVRSTDPLLSVYVMGDKLNLVDNLSEYSIGIGSNYDRLHLCGKEVSFLFFGANMSECFTYTHYMEAAFKVPYRYDREFNGIIVDEGKERSARAFLYSSYANCRLNPNPLVHDAMQERGQLRKEALGDTTLCCFREHDAYETISDLLTANPFCLTDGNFDASIRDTTYNPGGGRVVSVK